MLARLTSALQRVVLYAAAALPHARTARDVSWVVGPVEVATMVANVARAIPDSYSVSLVPSPFYSFAYDVSPITGSFSWFRTRILGAWILGRLSRRATGFLYIGGQDYLGEPPDAREFEFAWLKRRGLKVVCLFTGSDIRSPVLMRAFQAETGLENIVTYLDQVAPVFANPAYDERRKALALSADRHADLIFNARVDQLSYLTRPTEPFPYFLPDELVWEDDAKHENPERIIIVHAPSSPIIKGTQVVRAAIARLSLDGYDFDYRELVGVPHEKVLEALREAHIALNEFYAFVPGVFGVEAMASGCALLTRADENIETDLPKGSNQAWVVTSTADIYLNLKRLLDDPATIRDQASAGREWVRAHATASVSGAKIRALLGEL